MQACYIEMFYIKGCLKHFNSTPNPEFTLAHTTIQNNLVHMYVLSTYASLNECSPPHLAVENI